MNFGKSGRGEDAEEQGADFDAKVSRNLNVFPDSSAPFALEYEYGLFREVMAAKSGKTQRKLNATSGIGGHLFVWGGENGFVQQFLVMRRAMRGHRTYLHDGAIGFEQPFEHDCLLHYIPDALLRPSRRIMNETHFGFDSTGRFPCQNFMKKSSIFPSFLSESFPFSIKYSMRMM